MKDIFLLDMDDTLLDFRRAERTNLVKTLSGYGLRADDGVVARFHEINDGLWKMLERGELTRERLLVLRFEMLFVELSAEANAEAVANTYFHNFQHICCPFPGALFFLERLHAKGRAYIVTNGSADIQTKHIDDAGFRPYLSDVFISETVGWHKPSAEYAAYVAAHIPDFDRGRAVFIGDSLTSDRMCARRMGVDFLLFAPTGAPPGYEGAAASDFREALRILDEM